MTETFQLQCIPTDWLQFGRDERYTVIHERDHNQTDKYWINWTPSI